MNLSSLLPYLNRENDAEVEEKTGPKGVKSLGPATYKTMSSGQIRRAEQRERDAQARKATRRNRRRYMAEQQELANLRGARWVLMNRDKVAPAVYDNVVKAMERRYADDTQVPHVDLDGIQGFEAVGGFIEQDAKRDLTVDGAENFASVDA